MTAEVLVGRLRRFLLVLSVLVFLTTLAELILEEHTKETLQLLPFLLCGMGLIAVAAALLRPQRATFLALRAAMAMVALGGLLGIAAHLLNNFTFEQEIRPNAAALDVFLAALKGANPLLAPGTLVFAALLAFAATYYHPMLDR